MSQITTPLPSLMDPAVQSCPYELYKRLRDEQPVYRMPETGFYVVTRYDDVRRVLQDTENFRNGGPRPSGELQGGAMAIHERMLAERGWTAVETLQRSDPPAHTRYRKLVNRVFTPRRVNNDLQPRVEAITEELIDAFIDRGSCEFVNEFAILLPGVVMTEQLGLDRSQVTTFRQWVDALLAPKMYPLTEDEMVAVTEAALTAQHHFAAVFEERRRQPDRRPHVRPRERPCRGRRGTAHHERAPGPRAPAHRRRLRDDGHRDRPRDVAAAAQSRPDGAAAQRPRPVPDRASSRRRCASRARRRG